MARWAGEILARLAMDQRPFFNSRMGDMAFFLLDLFKFIKSNL